MKQEGYTANGLVAYCKEALNLSTVYMWGGLMRIATNSYIKMLADLYPSKYSASRKSYLETRIAKSYGCDCVGLIKSYYFGGVGSPEYQLSKDLNTTGFYGVATEKGCITDIPETPGLITYMEGHVGVYIGHGKVIECTMNPKYGDGVVETPLKGRGWTHWLKLPYITYDKTDCKCGCKCDNCADCTGYDEYIVKKGDSLWSIAKKFYGSGSLYTYICEVNGIKPNTVILPGDRLIITYGKGVI